ncbi:MAG: TonB-dependent receptor [Spirochaetales bacterium]|nr:TonB-dependent receptor [Spirochaetales bacterium]
MSTQLLKTDCVRALFFFIVMAIALPAVLSAQETADTRPPVPVTETNDDIVVTATRIPENTIEVPQFVTTITAEDIEASGKNDAAEIIAETAGISLSDQGPDGSLQNLMIRGAGSARVLVLLDGMPLNNSRDGQIDMSLIPSEIIDRIEIVQGGMSIMYGADAVGGVINIVTKKGINVDSFLNIKYTQTAYIPQTFSDGSDTYSPDPTALLDGKDLTASAAFDLGFMSLLAIGRFEQAENKFYFEQSGESIQRINAENIEGGGFVSGSVPWKTGTAILSVLVNAKSSGVPGRVDGTPDENTQEDIQIQTMVEYNEQEFIFSDLSTNAKIAFSQANRTFNVPGYDPSSTALSTVSADITQNYHTSDLVSFIYGGACTYDYIQSEYLGNRDRFHASGFLSAPLLLFNAVEITPAVRYDAYSDIDGALTYGIGSVIPVTDESSIKISFAKSFHAPTLYELFDPYMGNALLVPENGYSGDIGFSFAGDDLRLESAVFARYMTDEIKSYAPTYIPYNIDTSFYTGAEAHIEYKLISKLHIESNVVFLYSFDLSGGRTFSDNARIALVPMWEAQAAVLWRDDVITLRLSGNFTSDRYTDNTLTDTLPPYFTLDASLRYTVMEWFILTLAVDNILNAQYQIVADYPMPGTTIRVGMELQF